jgi:hypothetical protein
MLQLNDRAQASVFITAGENLLHKRPLNPLLGVVVTALLTGKTTLS